MHAYNFGTGEPSGVDPGHDLSETLLHIVYTLVPAGCKRQIAQRIAGSIGHFFGARRGYTVLRIAGADKDSISGSLEPFAFYGWGILPRAMQQPAGLLRSPAARRLFAHPSARGNEKSPAPTILWSSPL